MAKKAPTLTEYHKLILPYDQMKIQANTPREISPGIFKGVVSPSDANRRLAELCKASLFVRLINILKEKEKEGLTYTDEQIDDMKDKLDYYVDFKYVDIATQRESDIYSIINSWHQYPTPVKSIILNDMIMHGNSSTEELLSAHDDLSSSVSQKSQLLYENRLSTGSILKTIPVTTVVDGKRKQHSLLTNEADELRENIYDRAFDQFKTTIDANVKENLLQDALKVYGKNIYPTNIMLNLASNIEDLIYLSRNSQKSNKLLTEQDLKDNMTQPRKIYFANPNKIVARLNLINWALSYASKSDSNMYKTVSDKTSPPYSVLNDLLLTSEETFYGTNYFRNSRFSFSNEIDTAMKVLQYAPNESEKTKFPYISLLEQHINEVKEREGEFNNDDEKLFIRKFLNVEFGNPTKQEKEFMTELYKKVKERSFEEAKAKAVKEKEKQKQAGFTIIEGESDEGYTIYHVELKKEKPEPSIPKGGTREKPDNKTLDEYAIRQYIKDVKKRGIDLECIVEIEGGKRINLDQPVRMYVFKVGNYRILEAVGQQGNSTNIALGDTPTKEFIEKLVQSPTNLRGLKDDIVSVNHLTNKKSEDYSFNPNRILAIAQRLALATNDQTLMKKLALSAVQMKLLDDSFNGFITFGRLKETAMKDLGITSSKEASEYLELILEQVKEYMDNQEFLRDHVTIAHYSILQDPSAGLSDSQLSRIAGRVDELKKKSRKEKSLEAENGSLE